jgi:hypothetical protein
MQTNDLLNPVNNAGFSAAIDHLSNDLVYLLARNSISEIGIEKVHEMLLNYTRGKEESLFSRTPPSNQFFRNP